MNNFINILKSRILPVTGVLFSFLIIIRSIFFRDLYTITSGPGLVVILFGIWGLLALFYKGESKTIKNTISTIGSLALTGFFVFFVLFLALVLAGSD
jgi:hypothetical protein